MNTAGSIFEVHQENDAIRFVLSSTMENIDQVCERVTQYLPGKFDGIESEMFAVNLVIREGLTNAIRHGNENDPSKQVRFLMKIHPAQRQISLEIEDQGPGFDWKNQKGLKLPGDEEHGRGILIMETYFTSYSYNAKGNILYLQKDFTS